MEKKPYVTAPVMQSQPYVSAPVVPPIQVQPAMPIYPNVLPQYDYGCYYPAYNPCYLPTHDHCCFPVTNPCCVPINPCCYPF